MKLKNFFYLLSLSFLLSGSLAYAAATVFKSQQLAPSPVNLRILQTDGTNNSWVVNSSGGSGTFNATSSNTSSANGVLFFNTTSTATSSPENLSYTSSTGVFSSASSSLTNVSSTRVTAATSFDSPVGNLTSVSSTNITTTGYIQSKGNGTLPIQTWLTSGGTAIQRVNSGGGTGIGSIANDVDTNGWLRVIHQATGDVGLALRGINSQTGDYFDVNTGASAGNTTGNVFNIKASGNVGLGTPYPSSTIHVVTSTPIISLSQATTTPESQRFDIRVGASSTATGTLDIFDFTGNATRLSIASSGNVGIGTAYPSSTLHVVGTFQANKTYIDAAGRLLVNVASPFNGNAWASFNGSNNIWTNWTKAGTGSGLSYGLRVEGGTNTSDKAMEILNSGATTDYFLIQGDGNAELTKGLSIGTSTIFSATSVLSVWSTSSAPTFFVTSSGTVGIGTAYPSSTLHVVGQTIHSTSTSVGTSTLSDLFLVATSSKIFTVSSTGNVVINSNNLLDAGGNKYSTSTGSSGPAPTLSSCDFNSANASLPDTNFATPGRTTSTNSTYSYLAYNKTTQWTANWMCQISSGITITTSTFDMAWSSTSTASATTSVAWQLGYVSANGSTSLSAAFTTSSLKSIYASTTASLVMLASTTLTASNFIPGQLVMFQIAREVSNASDTLTTDAQLLWARLRFW